MPEEREHSLGIEVEQLPESPFDLLRVTLPLPRLLFLPEETRGHLRAARREQLLALRSLLDAAIAGLEEKEKPERRAERVDIE